MIRPVGRRSKAACAAVLFLCRAIAVPARVSLSGSAMKRHRGKFPAVLAVILSIPFTLLPCRASAGHGGQFTGVTNCFIGGRWVTVKGNCPAESGGGSGGGGTPSGSNAAANGGLSGAGYQLGYAFGRWLFGADSNPQAELQKRLMMEELRRRREEAERQHRAEEARRLAEIHGRLSRSLKLSGLPDLRMKGGPGEGPGLKLKLGDGAGRQAGVDGLPGIYLEGGGKPYGIPGLPGVYTGGPGEGSGLTASGLKLKTGEDAGGGAQAPPGDPSSGNRPVGFDPEKMSPQQLAEVAEQVGKLPPEVQERLFFMAQDDASAKGSSSSPPPPASLQKQSAASQAAGAAAVPEDASWKAGIGFDRPPGPGPVHLEGTNPGPKSPGPETPARP